VIEAVADEFERWLSHLLAVACSARRHPDEWRAIRRAWLPGAPDAPASASYLGEAAHPSEVREVMVALRDAYAARLPPQGPGESEAMRDFRRHRLADFVRTETSAYIARVTPKPDIRSLFAQATARGGPQVAAAGFAPSVTVRTCRSCGAPREADTVYGCCAFCGTAFFPEHGFPEHG
jgi:hypothetical protein